MKGLLLHELVDGLRELIMEKRYLRKQITSKMVDGILPNVLKELNQVSNNLRVVNVTRSDDDCAEVDLKRHTVDLKNHNCSCRVWQVTGKPCHHALAWILSNRGVQISAFVHDYYSVAKFKAAYEGRVTTMPNRFQWPVVDMGFQVWTPLQKRAPGRPKVQRIRGALEKGPKKKVRCSRCKGYGHFAKTCNLQNQQKMLLQKHQPRGMLQRK